MPEDGRGFPELTEPSLARPDAAPKRSTAVIAGVVAVVLLLGFGLIATLVPKPPVAAGILTATAADDGGYHQDGEVTADPLIAATATVLESRRTVNASSSISNSNGDRLFDRTLAIFSRSDDLLMQRVGLALFEKLRDAGRFQQVRYLPMNERLPDGERLPEIFVTVEKTAWKESGLPGNRQFEGELAVTASDRYLRSSHSYQSTLSPPQIDFRWQADIEYSATQTGIETSGARYQAVSRDLASEIADELTTFVDDAAKKYGPAVEAPGQFYPEYAPPPQFDFVSDLGAGKLIDGPALMRPTVTVWQTPDERIPREVLAGVRESLAAAGWKVPQDEQDREYLRATREDQVVEVFRRQDGRWSTDRDDDAKERVLIAYTRSMSSDEMDAAVEQMLSDGADTAALAMFQRHWYRHREAIEEYFRTHVPADAASWLQLARVRQKSDPEGAREALLRATALGWIFRQQAPDSSMKKLGKELGLEDLPREVSPEMIESLGIARLDSAGDVTLTAQTDTPLAFWLGDEDDKQTWLLLTLRSRGTGSGLDLKINRVELSDRSSIRSEQTMTKPEASKVWEHRLPMNDGQAIEIACEPTDKESTYRLNVRRTPVTAAVRQ